MRIDALPGHAETITALNRAGINAERIADYTGWSASGIRRWLRARGLWRSPRMTAVERAEIERLYYEGWSAEAIGRAVGRTHGAVRYYLRGRDMWRPERTRVTPKMAEKIRAWYDRGIPVAVIGDRLGISETTIYGHVTPSRRGGVKGYRWFNQYRRIGD